MQTSNFKKIAILGVRWPPETFLHRLIQGLVSRGVQVDLGTTVPIPPATELPPGIHLIYLPSWDIPVAERIARFIGMIIRGLIMGPSDVFRFFRFAMSKPGLLPKIESLYRHLPLSGKRWDIIYFPWNVGAVKFHGLTLTGTPVIISCRGSQVNVAPKSPELSHYTKGITESFQTASAVHCVSEDICKQAQTIGLDRAKAKIIRPAVDPEFFSPDPRKTASPAGELNVLSVGNLNWRKGFELAIVAIRNLANYGIRVNFDIIGQGEDFQRLLFTINDVGLSNQVRLLGKMPPDKVRDKLRSCDVFYLSSHTEGISNAVLEAMSCGIPVVTTDCGGMSEAVTDGVEGFLVPILSPQSASEALKKLADDPALRKRMGEAARKRVIQQFTLDRQVDEFHALCNGVARGGVA